MCRNAASLNARPSPLIRKERPNVRGGETGRTKAGPGKACYDSHTALNVVKESLFKPSASPRRGQQCGGERGAASGRSSHRWLNTEHTSYSHHTPGERSPFYCCQIEQAGEEYILFLMVTMAYLSRATSRCTPARLQTIVFTAKVGIKA